jgi:subtilisin family serine protease
VGGSCGRGVRIGIIDGVVATDHPALSGQRLTYRSFHRKGWRPTAADHGTAIAAMMIGKPADRGFGGVLPGAELFAANIFGRSRDGQVGGDAVAILRALEWMIKMKVHVVNMSFAGGDHKLLRLAIEKAQRSGIVAVASVGNWGSSTRRAYPAALESVIAVTAVTRDMRIYGHANKGDYVDFAAPGVRIWTAIPNGGKFQNGTSFATPFISALIGAAVARGAAPNPKALRLRLGRSVLDLGAPGRDQVFGLGFVIGEPKCGAEG